MARPQPRGRRPSRDEEEDERGGRRGRAEKPPPSGPSPAMIAGGVGFLVVMAVVGIAVANMGKKAPPPAAPVVQAPPKKAPEVVLPPKPTKIPPKPLTDSEKSYLDGLFRQAQPHVDAAQKFAKEGWSLKNDKEDNEGANAAWVKAKHEYQAAVGIVNAAIEDEDKFPLERPGMGFYNSILGRWVKEMSGLPKVNVVK